MISELDPSDLAMAYVAASRIKAARIAIAVNAMRRSFPSWDNSDKDITADDVRSRALKDLSNAIALARNGQFDIANTLTSGFMTCMTIEIQRNYQERRKAPSFRAGI
jgi:hypothetical protein